MRYNYKTSGTCSKEIIIDMGDDGKIEHVEFISGCPGNLLGIGQIVVGMTPEHVIERFKGVKCGPKSTSCPDQLARALEQIIELENNKN